jgi:cytochrome c-type biogenesis protein CcsB
MFFMAFLLLVLAVSLAIATFVENSYGTETARVAIYNSHWLEAVWLLLAVNLFHNLKKYGLFSRTKLTLGIFHVAFVVMILGAAITRYFGYEGTLHIRENEKGNRMLSKNDCFYAGFGEQEKQSDIYLSESVHSHFSSGFKGAEHRVKVKIVGFIHNAEKRAVPSETGTPIIDFVLALPDGQGMLPFSIREGEVVDYPGFSAGFSSKEKKTVNFYQKDGTLFMIPSVKLEETTMAVGERQTFYPGDTIAVKPMFLYEMGNFRFLVRKYLPSATFEAVKSPVETRLDAVLVKISAGDKKQMVPVFGHSGKIADTVRIPIEGGTLNLAYGAKSLAFPFEIYLKDFQIKHYSGSDSPSSFASEVTLIDSVRNVNRDYQIYMNNTMKYRGYKFFQSSYDSDEKGTILSVNHDSWGTSVSYLGYALLFLGIVLSLFNKSSRFQQLLRKLNQGNVKTVLLFLLFSGIVSASFAQTDSLKAIPDIDKQVVSDFNRLWVQGVDGRIEPMSTLSSEILRKISGKSVFQGKSAAEIMLSMMVAPKKWQTVRMVKVKNKSLADVLGAKNKYISIYSLFDEQGHYKISNSVRSAYAKNPATRTRVDKEYIYLDERVNICFMIFRGDFLHIFPTDEQKRWAVPGQLTGEYAVEDSLFVKSGFDLLLHSISENNTEDALNVLSSIDRFQQEYAASVLPSSAKKKVEIFYNRVNPFKRIFPFYLLSGFLLLCFLFVNIFRMKPQPQIIQSVLFGLILLLFIIHTSGLIMRWYIAGHAPWSNGFESIVYVAWATMFAGFIFGRKQAMVIGTAAFLSGIALFVAHLSWMNPEVTNLVPVLRSYWLTLHVAVITASYGFLGLSMFVGILVMIFFAIRNENNCGKVSFYIDRLSLINELSVTVGLYFLTVGTFLGAIWANESWGRYWGWDPKETWALITILVYAFVAHMRFIPRVQNLFAFNVASIMAFFSVMMTYFGVNYYLTGLHSYGSDVASGIGPYLFIVVVILIALIVIAYVRFLKFREKNN